MMMASLLEEFASQVFNNESDIKVYLRVEKPAEVSLKGSNTGRTVRWMQVWPHWRKLPQVHILPSLILQFLSQYHFNMTLYNNAERPPCTSWSERWVFILHSFHDKAFLVNEYWIDGVAVTVSTSSRKHRSAEMGSFPVKFFLRVIQWDTTVVRHVSQKKYGQLSWRQSPWRTYNDSASPRFWSYCGSNLKDILHLWRTVAHSLYRSR